MLPSFRAPLCAMVLLFFAAGCQHRPPERLDLVESLREIQERSLDAEPVRAFAQRLLVKQHEAPQTFNPADGVAPPTWADPGPRRLHARTLRGMVGRTSNDQEKLMPIEFVDAPELSSPHGYHYAAVATSSRTIYTSGQVGVDAGDLEQRMRPTARRTLEGSMRRRLPVTRDLRRRQLPTVSSHAVPTRECQSDPPSLPRTLRCSSHALTSRSPSSSPT